MKFQVFSFSSVLVWPMKWNHTTPLPIGVSVWFFKWNITRGNSVFRFLFYFRSGKSWSLFCNSRKEKKSRDDCSIVDLFQVVLIPWWVREEDTFTYTHKKCKYFLKKKRARPPFFSSLEWLRGNLGLLAKKEELTHCQQVHKVFFLYYKKSSRSARSSHSFSIDFAVKVCLVRWERTGLSINIVFSFLFSLFLSVFDASFCVFPGNFCLVSTTSSSAHPVWLCATLFLTAPTHFELCTWKKRNRIQAEAAFDRIVRRAWLHLDRVYFAVNRAAPTSPPPNFLNPRQ